MAGALPSPRAREKSSRRCRALRAYQSEHVQRAEPQNEAPFPLCRLTASGTIVTVYDLSAPLPCCAHSRQKKSGSRRTGMESAGTLRAFNDAELNAILSFLRAVQ